MLQRNAGNVLLVLTVVLLSACARGAQESRGRSNELSQQEIIASGASDLHAVVQQLRPRWLDVRAPRSINSDTRVLVFQGRTLLGGPEALREFDTKSVLRLRYLDSAQAYATLSFPGGQHVAGAIIIELLAGSR